MDVSLLVLAPQPLCVRSPQPWLLHPQRPRVTSRLSPSYPRVTQAFFDYLEGGETPADFLGGVPSVSREAVVAALEEAKHLLLARC